MKKFWEIISDAALLAAVVFTVYTGFFVYTENVVKVMNATKYHREIVVVHCGKEDYRVIEPGTTAWVFTECGEVEVKVPQSILSPFRLISEGIVFTIVPKDLEGIPPEGGGYAENR